MEKGGPPRNQTNHSKGIDESYPKMYFLLNSIHYVKSYYTSHDLGQHIYVLHPWLHATKCNKCTTDIVN